MLGLIWIQPDTLMHDNRMDFSLRYLLTHISLVGHRQTAQTQIRCQITWRLIRVSTVCLRNVLLKFNEKKTPNNPKIGNELVLLIEMGTIASPYLLIVKGVYLKGGYSLIRVCLYRLQLSRNYICVI